MNSAHLAPVLPDWDEIEPGWWYQVARDGCEVHLSFDEELGWAIQVLRQGSNASRTVYVPNLATALVLAMQRVEQHSFEHKVVAAT